MADKRDTITAIATPVGRSGIAVIRVSGPLCTSITRALTGVEPEPRNARYCSLRSNSDEIIDRGILIYFKGPASYTGEDVIEIHSHGGRIIPGMLIQRILELGARHAQPGEFSERAFLNGKIDLLQAEAIADLIDSSSERAARSAMRSLEGEFSAQIESLLQKLIQARVYVEGALDFPEEEIDFMDEGNIAVTLEECLQEIGTMLDKVKRGRVLREGFNIVIIGKPNVGKSSLLNRLARAERAIVTNVPGTTRDLIEEQVYINGFVANVADTAGIRETGDEIEQEGVRRALSALESADIVLLVADSTVPDAEAFDVSTNILAGKRMIVVNNKIDLSGMLPEVITGDSGVLSVNISAKTGEGMELLLNQLQQEYMKEASGEDVILARGRHIDALGKTGQFIKEGLEKYRHHRSAELLAEELRHAQDMLGTVTGKFIPDDLLGEIFSRFCIGK